MVVRRVHDWHFAYVEVDLENAAADAVEGVFVLEYNPEFWAKQSVRRKSVTYA